MTTREINDKIKFMLPAGFILSRDEDDEGNEVVHILAGEYINDEGETHYKFDCRIGYCEYTLDDVDEDCTSSTLLDSLAKRMPDSRRMKLPGSPRMILLNKAMPLSIFGRIIKMYASIGLIQVSDWSALQLVTAGTFNDDDPEANSERYEFFYEVLKATRINGKKLPIDTVSPSQIEEALQLTFEEDGEAVDVSPKIQFNFTNGDETTTYEYTTDGMKEVGKEYLTRVTPDMDLYPHYNSVRSAGNLGFLGATVVVNASGTEYEFIPFRKAAENDEAAEDMKALYNRVIAKDTEHYDLHEKAAEMRKLFHVNKSAFDPRHDRECELKEGYMHRAYMMSGLRSFAWTLADYCKQHDCAPDDVDNTIASRIANFVANEDWLNYDGDTYCQGLCSGSDLHVYFVPDGVTQADREKLLPSQEDRDRVKKMKAKFPTYREILSEVHSLNALREDLAYIYPAIKTLWDSLEESRDYDEALLGNEADIVYAWCALALAAKEPFFTEDGPMTCFFSQIPEEINTKNALGKKSISTPEKTANNVTLSASPRSDFRWDPQDRTKITSYLGNEQDVIIPDGTTAIGKYAFSSSESLTSIIIPEGVVEIEEYAFADCTQLASVRLPDTLVKIGKWAFLSCESLMSITVPDGVTEIEGDTFSGCKNLTSVRLPDMLIKIGDFAFSSCESLTSITIPESVMEIEDCTFLNCRNLIVHLIQGSYAEEFCNDNGIRFGYLSPDGAVSIPIAFLYTDFKWDPQDRTKITSYLGSEKDVVIPDGTTVIGDWAFSECESLTSVTIPEGVVEIEEYAFDSCKQLTSVRLPETLEKIGQSAFYGCERLPAITIPEGVIEIEGGAFSDCKQLASVQLPDTLVKIGESAFSRCESLTSITIPEGVTEIERDAFSGCKNLTSVRLPDTLVKIGDWAFSGCESLMSITIPEGVTEIEGDPFYGCENLIVHLVQDSAAEEYCNDNEIRFEFFSPGGTVNVPITFPYKCDADERIQAVIDEEQRLQEAEAAVCQCAAEKAKEQARLKREAEEEERRRVEEAAKEAEHLHIHAEEDEQKRLEAEEEELAQKRRELEEIEIQIRETQAELKRLKEELAQQQSRYDDLTRELADQETIIAQNRAWFGAGARARKAAQARAEELRQLIEKEFPNGRP